MVKRQSISLHSCQPYLRVINMYPCERGFRTGTRRQYAHYFLYVHKGIGNIVIGDQRYSAISGDMFFCTPGCINSIEADCQEPFLLSGIDFDFVQDYRSDPLSENIHIDIFKANMMTPPVDFTDFSGFPAHMHMASQPQVRRLVLEMYQEYSQRQLFWQVKVNSLLLNLIVQIARLIQQGAAADANIQRNQEIISFIASHYAEPINNQLLSQRFNYHPDHLNRIILRYTGMTVHQYIIDLRMRSAISLLQQGNDDIGQIACAVGYPDLQSFSRMFKKKTGTAPSRYRDYYMI